MNNMSYNQQNHHYSTSSQEPHHHQLDQEYDHNNNSAYTNHRHTNDGRMMNQQNHHGGGGAPSYEDGLPPDGLLQLDGDDLDDDEEDLDVTETETSEHGGAGDNIDDFNNTVTKPGLHDVLLGRGGGTNNHVGNVKFRKLVNEHKMRYLACSKVDKPKVARQVVALWRKLDPPGRFLSRVDDTKRGPGSVKASDNVWIEVGDKKAREKASQCLRERTPDVMPYIKHLREQQNAMTEQGVTLVQMQLQQQQNQERNGLMQHQSPARGGPHSLSPHRNSSAAAAQQQQMMMMNNANNSAMMNGYGNGGGAYDSSFNQGGGGGMMMMNPGLSPSYGGRMNVPPTRRSSLPVTPNIMSHNNSGMHTMQQHNMGHQSLSNMDHPGNYGARGGNNNMMGYPPSRRTSLPSTSAVPSSAMDPSSMMGGGGPMMHNHPMMFHNNPDFQDNGFIHNNTMPSSGMMGGVGVDCGGDEYDISEMEYQQQMMLMQQQMMQQQMQMQRMQQSRQFAAAASQQQRGGPPNTPNSSLRHLQQHQGSTPPSSTAHIGGGGASSDLPQVTPSSNSPHGNNKGRSTGSSDDNVGRGGGATSAANHHKPKRGRADTDDDLHKSVPDRTTSLMSLTPANIHEHSNDHELSLEDYRQQLEEYIANSHVQNNNNGNPGHHHHANSHNHNNAADQDDGESDLEDDWEKEREHAVKQAQQMKKDAAAVGGQRGVNRNASGMSILSKASAGGMSLVSGFSGLSDLLKDDTKDHHHPSGAGGDDTNKAAGGAGGDREQKMNMARSVSSNLSIMSELTDLSQNIDNLSIYDD